MTQRQTVLIVDDIPENIDVLSEILKDEYRLKVALNGEEALEIVNSAAPPDLVLLDVMMPRMDGYEACRRMKANTRTAGIPIIFITAQGDEEHETLGFEIGAVDYITKPVNPVIVKARVRTHLSLHNQSVALENLVKERTRDLYATRLEIVHRLGVAAEFKDGETGSHILRMSQYCRVLAQGIGLDDAMGELLLHAAPMHDVGKIGIPDSILSKPGKLDSREWEVMQTHTTIGGKIIGDHKYDLMIVAKKIALSHHERWDGTGYPEGLSGEEIPIEGRIAAIADVFDALTSKRCYKSAWSTDKAREFILSGRGTHFDPKLIDVFAAKQDEILAIKGRLSDE
ncbi:MAG: two-component system response regulator [Desulfovibrionaceae bacterium]